MSRTHFKTVHEIPVVDLLLDTHNPRIRHGADQNDCIARILEDGEPFLNLVKDIAAEGLSVEHILISKNADGKWVVRDGNRRVTALKLLLKPSLCTQNKGLSSLLARIADAAAHPIPTMLDCLTSDNEAQILKYIANKHTGENAGVGQKGWTALMIALFNLQLGVTDQNRRAAQLLTWLEENDLKISNGFPITTLTRAINRDNLRLIGFDLDGDKLVATLPTLQAYALAARVVRAIETGEVNVARGDEAGSIYSIERQTAFFTRIRNEIGPPLAPPTQPEPAAAAPAGEQGGKPDLAGDGMGSPPPTPSNPADSRPSSVPAKVEPPEGSAASPTKSSWDRNYLFGSAKGASPRLPIARDQKKAANIVAELRQLNVKLTPIAVGMLLRCLIEQSTNYYRSKHPEIGDQGALHKNLAKCADHMQSNGALSQNQHEAVIAHSRTEGGILHVKTLNLWVHRDNFHPTHESINSLWDEVGCFVQACWA